MRHRASLVLRIAAGIVAVSFGAVLVRLAGEAAPLAIAAWRLTLAAAVLSPIPIVRGSVRRMTPRQLGWSLLSGAALAVHFVLWFTSLEHTSVASSVLFMSTHPAFVGVGSWLLLREKTRAGAVAGILLAVAGGAAMTWADLRLGEMSLRGDLLALGGGIALAGYFLIGRKVRRDVCALNYVAVTYLAAAVLVLAACLVSGTSVVGFAPKTYGYLVLLAIGPQLIGHSTFNWALKHIAASNVSILVLSEAIGSTVLAFLLFGESLHWLNGVGGFLILLGITLSSRSREDGHGSTDRAQEDRMGGGPHAASR